jgi:hypothetical protein
MAAVEHRLRRDRDGLSASAPPNRGRSSTGCAVTEAASASPRQVDYRLRRD